MTLLRDVPLQQAPVVAPQTVLADVDALLEEDPLGTAVLVGDGTYMGFINRANLKSGLIPRKVDRATLPVGPYASASRRAATPDMEVDDALALMRRRGVDILPVVHNNRYLGVVTRQGLEDVAEDVDVAPVAAAAA